MLAGQSQPNGHAVTSGQSLAYCHDIPGSRCGPEDGWPRAYQVLHDKEMWTELAALARPQKKLLDGRYAYCVNFQPCYSARTQDRYVARELDIHGRTWTLAGVFDGHLGDATVEHTAHHLPIIIRDFLRDAFAANPSRTVDPTEVSDILSRSITSFDDAIASDVLDLFTDRGGVDALSNAEIAEIINDGGPNYKKARLCMYGTTALVALVDPSHSHLWVANLGDCQASLVSRDADVDVLTTVHNGDNDAEVARVQAEHPGEPHCVVDRRVLGAIAPFRCIGDTPFKQPPAFTRRILYNLYPGVPDTSPWEEFLVRNRTPPYISTTPEVMHRPLPRGAALVLASDGFTDLCSASGERHVLAQWAHGPRGENRALRLLWQALGGEDSASVSRVLTLDMDAPWIDDTAIVVLEL